MKKLLIPVALAIICIAPPAFAEETPQVEKQVVVETPSAPEPKPIKPHWPTKPHWQVSEDELSDLRGGEMVAIGNQTLIGITQGNILNGDYTAGSVAITENALSNFSGVGNLVINTGGQVTLQSGLNLVINVSN
jgi:hypothetical protein